MTDGTGLTNVDASTFHGTGAAETVFSLHNLRHLTPIFANCHLHFFFLGTIVKVNWGGFTCQTNDGASGARQNVCELGRRFV